MKKCMIFALCIAVFSNVEASQKKNSQFGNLHESEESLYAMRSENRKFIVCLQQLGIPAVSDEIFFEFHRRVQKSRGRSPNRSFIGYAYDQYFLSHSAVAALDAWRKKKRLELASK